jgi:hypothetical protein
LSVKYKPLDHKKNIKAYNYVTLLRLFATQKKLMIIFQPSILRPSGQVDGKN